MELRAYLERPPPRPPRARHLQSDRRLLWQLPLGALLTPGAVILYNIHEDSSRVSWLLALPVFVVLAYVFAHWFHARQEKLFREGQWTTASIARRIPTTVFANDADVPAQTLVLAVGEKPDEVRHFELTQRNEWFEEHMPLLLEDAIAVPVLIQRGRADGLIVIGSEEIEMSESKRR